MTLNKVKQAIDNFEQVQKEYSSFGAWDTEPDGVWHSHLVGALQGKMPSRMSAAKWDLFTCSMNCTEAAKKLTAASKAACKTLKLAIANQNNPSKIVAYIKDYCWRCETSNLFQL